MNHTPPATAACSPRPLSWGLIGTKVLVIVLVTVFALFALHIGHEATAAVAAASALGYALVEALRRLRDR